MTKNSLWKSLPPIQRRQFLRWLGLATAAPWVTESTRYGIFDMIGGEALAQNQTNLPTYFLEVNFRDQWDFGGAFIAPWLGKNRANISTEGDAGAAIFSQIKAVPNTNHFITSEADEIMPHMGDVAVMELGEDVIGGVHGHEASNALRSPGRSKQTAAGKTDMASVDKRPGGRVGGNEVHLSSTPTPAILHNYHQKKNGFSRNGVLLRSAIRRNVHTFYHFEANLPNAQLDRFFDKNSLFSSFAKTPATQQSLLSRHEKLIFSLLGQVDKTYLNKLKSPEKRLEDHRLAMDNLSVPKENFSLQMSGEEVSRWSKDIPGQFTCPGDNVDKCAAAAGSMNLGEMFGYVAKLFINDIVRTAAVDFDFHDVHTRRNAFIMQTQGNQTAKPLARLITELKKAGIWDRTVIAMYTLDGSRSIKRNSTGRGTKNAVILAGGKIKGQYFGDIRYKSQSEVTFHRPDDNGNPIADGTTKGDKRVPSADVYKTVMNAAGVPDNLINTFPDAKGGKRLNYFFG